MKNQITVLHARSKSCRTIFKADGTKEKDLKEWAWTPYVYALEGNTHIEQLQDLKKLIQDCRDHDGGHVFIRGEPNSKRDQDGYWHRAFIDKGKGYYTTDVRQTLFWIDVDNLPLKEGQPYTAETFRANLAEKIDFINLDTAMLVDFSSSATITNPSIMKGHAFMIMDMSDDNEFLIETFKQNYPFIDWRGSQTAQPLFIEEPTIEKGSDWHCSLTERTVLLDGELVSRFRISPLTIHAVPTRVSHNERSNTKNITLNEVYETELRLIEGERNTNIYQFFCKCAYALEPKQYWIDRYYRDPRRDAEHSLEYITEQYTKAEEFVHGRYLKRITNKKGHEMIYTQTEDIRKVLPKTLNNVWAVKSPQATYKTQCLKEIIAKDDTALLIGHRTILIRQICSELGWSCYDDIISNDTYHLEDQLGITYHSLHHLFNTYYQQDHEKFTKRKYKTIVIDECDQVLSSLALDYELLVKEQGQEIKDVWNYLGEMVRRADNVICMDADLSDITMTFLEEFRSDKFQIYNNSWRKDGKTVFRLRSPDAFLEKLSEEIEADRNVFVTCETIRATKQIKKWIEINHPDIHCLRIDGTTKDTYKEIFNNPNIEIPKLMKGTSSLGDWYGKKMKVMIVNSVMTTGVSIYRNNKGIGFHTVMGMFNWAELYGGADMRQAIRRVRDADTYYAFVLSGGIYTDIGTTLKTLANYYEVDMESTPLEKVRKLIQIRKDLDKANRINSFKASLQDIGWGMKMIGKRLKDKDGNAYDWDAWSDLNTIIDDEEYFKLFHATDIADVDFEKLRKNQQNEYTYKKHLIKKCFYEDGITDENTADLKITEEMVKRYAKGNISEKYKIRKILSGDIDVLLSSDLASNYDNFQYTAFIKEVVGKVFDCLQFNQTDFVKINSAKPKIIFAFQIEDSLFKYIAQQDNVETLDRLLKKYRLNYLSMQTLYDEHNQLDYRDENKLRAFMKIAKMPDYEVSYVNPKDVKAQYGSLTLTSLRKEIKKDKNIEQEIKDRVSLNKPEYIEKLKIAIGKQKRVTPKEMLYLRQNLAHLKITNFNPEYTRFLTSFIDSFSELNKAKKSDNKTLTQAIEQAEQYKEKTS